MTNTWSSSNMFTLVNDNHVDNYPKKIVGFVYYGSTVNNEPNNSLSSQHST